MLIGILIGLAIAQAITCIVYLARVEDSEGAFIAQSFLFFVPVLVVMVIWWALWCPWKNVVHAVDADRFKMVQKISSGKQFRILPRFYFCTDPAAKNVFNKLFFVRIKRG